MNTFKPNQLWTLRGELFVITGIRDEECYYVNEDFTSSFFIKDSFRALWSVYIDTLPEPTLQAAAETYPELFI